MLNFKGGSGSGYHIGVFGEYKPLEKYWGGNLRINLYDFRTGSNSTDPEVSDSLKTNYEYNSQLSYLTIAPLARYNTKFWNLYFLFGPEIEINYSNVFRYHKRFENTGQIEDRRRLEFDKLKARFGIQLGMGYDILFAEISGRSRMQFSPYVTFHFASSILNQNDSRWNQFATRVGLSIKYGIDRVSYDTLYFNPFHDAPPIYLASARIEEGVSFPGLRSTSEIPAMMLAYIERPQIVEELPEVEEIAAIDIIEATPDIADLIPDVSGEQTPARTVPIVEQNITRRFTFPSSSATALNNEMTSYLDEVAQFIRANPGYEVRIVGHSDNTGTTPQNLERSQQRALAVQRYLISRGIALFRLPANGVGALDPIATNATEEGRRANRRVEITVIRP